MMLETLSLERILKRGALKRLSRSYTAKNPAQENIQGVKINLVKKNNNRQMPAVQEGGCNIYGRRSRLANQP